MRAWSKKNTPAAPTKIQNFAPLNHAIRIENCIFILRNPGEIERHTFVGMNKYIIDRIDRMYSTAVKHDTRLRAGKAYVGSVVVDHPSVPSDITVSIQTHRFMQEQDRRQLTLAIDGRTRPRSPRSSALSSPSLCRPRPFSHLGFCPLPHLQSTARLPSLPRRVVRAGCSAPTA